MNYRFKQAIKEELARLESVHLNNQEQTVSTLRAFDYAKILRARTIRSSMSRFSLTSALRFLSMLF